LSRIVIADDHPMVRAALREAVLRCRPQGECMDCASFQELDLALSQCHGEVELIVLDLTMPGMQGFVGLMTVLATWPTVPVVMVSASEDTGTIARARACGAAGFIPKSAPMDEIASAMNVILGGGEWFPHYAASRDESAAQDVARKVDSLTAQQMRVLQLIVEGKLNKQIAGDMNLAEQTVKGHVSAILRKFDVYSRTQIVLAVSPLLVRENGRGAGEAPSP